MSDSGSFFEKFDVSGAKEPAPTRPPDRGRGGPSSKLLAAIAGGVILALALGWFVFVRDGEDAGTAANGEGTAAGGEISDEAQALLDEGLAAHQNDDLDAASAAYAEVLHSDPTNKVALYNLGLIAQTRGALEDAERSYRAALTTDPLYPPALFNLAIIRYDAGDFNGAVDLYRQLIVADPNNAAAHLNLGFALRSAGQIEQGDQSIATAIRLDPSLESRQPQPTDTTIAGEAPEEGE
jgi:tetratricopeptide (TPR) repeat protein